MSTAWLIVYSIFNALLTALAQILLKFGVNRIGTFSTGNTSTFFMKALTSPLVWCGAGLYGLSLVIWLAVLSKTNVSVAYPLLSLTYVFSMILAMWLLGEKVVLWQWIGAACIILGTVFIFRST